MSKKILILANSSSGLYDFRNELISELLKDASVTASVPAFNKTDELIQLGCSIIDTPIDRRGVNPFKDLKLFFKYLKIIREESPDLVITYTIKPNVYGGLAARLKKVPYAANVTGLGTTFQNQGLLRSLVMTLYRLGLKKAKCVFFENAENLQIFEDNKITKKTQNVLLHGAGVNLGKYQYAEYPAESDETRFLFIGRVMKEKGVDELFSAMKKLRSEGYLCRLDVLGDYEEDYKKQIEQYQAEGLLKYHGYVLDVRPFITNCHCFVLPSWHEGMANTNLECAASGRPIITSNIHGCKEAVIGNKTGLLCEKQDPQSLYDCMKKFIETPYGEKASMGKKARKHMEQTFDKRKVIEETVAALLS